MTQEPQSASGAQQATEESAAGRPAAKFAGSGGLQLAVWKHKSDSGHEHYSIRIDRNYKDGDGNFQATAYLRDGDLLRVQKLLDQADDWIEQDKARQRGTLSAQSR